jgi:dihydroorotase
VHVISVEGPGYDLLHTMSKLLNCGVPLADIVGMSTSRPALAIRRPDLGHLGVGAVADISVLREMETDYTFADVTGVTRQGTRILQPLACYLGGQEMEVSTRPFEAPYLYANPHHRHDHQH